MKTLILQHADFERPAAFLAEPELLGDYKIQHSYLNPEYPEPETYDRLILLGGPMSVHDDREHSWLKAEKRFIEKNILAKRPIIGICLGAQLIASVLGAKVSPNPNREIGWFEIVRVSAGEETDPVFGQLPASFLTFHWHGETFSLAAGAELLASSQACQNQAFRYGDRIYALQFHPEVDESFIVASCEHCPEDLKHGSYVQRREIMLAGLTDDRVLDYNRALLKNLLNQTVSPNSSRQLKD